jgi:hypothetical protein
MQCASPKGFGRSPTIAFPGAVTTFTLSVVSFTPFLPIHLVLLSMSERVTVQGKDWQKRDDEAQSRHPIRAKR